MFKICFACKNTGCIVDFQRSTLLQYEETQVLLRKNADSAMAINHDLVKSRTYAEYLLNIAKEEIESLKHKVNALFCLDILS